MKMMTEKGWEAIIMMTKKGFPRPSMQLQPPRPARWNPEFGFCQLIRKRPLSVGTPFFFCEPHDVAQPLFLTGA